MTEKNKGKSEVKNEDKAEKSLFLFFSTTDQLVSVLQSKSVLNKLTVIGQNIESLGGIEELKNLEELWIVECSLKQEQVAPICKCTGLKRLYLYDNELTAIPDLELLTKLSNLWLSNNLIESLQGINSLENVREMCLSNNNIATIDVKLKPTLKITFLNLAGNPIKNFKEIQKLEPLRRLRWLVLRDPLFRTSPVALLANLRTAVIHSLPSLEKLDALHISQAERAQTVKFCDTSLEHYRLSLHNSLTKLYALQKLTIDLEIKELGIIWDALRRHCPSSKKEEGGKSNNLRFWEDEGVRWKERQKLLHDKINKMSKVMTAAVNFEVETCGNLKFLEIDLTEESVTDRLKNQVLSYVCSRLKGNVVDINIQNAWSVQGHYQTTVFQSQFRDGSKSLYIATPVGDLDVQPFQFIYDVLFENVSEELFVTNCLAHADPLVSDGVTLHRQLLLRSQTLLASRLIVVCGITDPSQLSVQGASCNGCNQWLLRDPSLLIPLYLLHYHYVFQDYFKPLKMLPTEAETALPLPLPLDTKLSQNVTSLQLVACNLRKLDIPMMEHVTTVDLSYNLLEDIYAVGSIFPKLTSLNVAFNKIHTIFNIQGLQNVTHLTLPWNFLSDFLSALRSLKGLCALKLVDISNNPFRDVTNELHQQFFVCKHLKSLMTFNSYPLSRSLLRGEVTLQGQGQFPTVPAWRRPKPPLSLRWKAELSDTESENHLGVINNQVISLTLKGLKLVQFRSVFSLNKLKWLDLTDNLFSGSAILKAASPIEELNLSQNVIEAFPCPGDKFKYLTKLNLSHNYITTLNSFNSEAFPQLKFLDLSKNKLQFLVGLSGLSSLTELYLSHNRLQDPNTLVHCKDMRELRVLDVTYNPIVEKDSFRSVCLYHISSLKYINGCKVRLSEAKSAVSLYEGLLDQNYLTRINKNVTIDNLTQLSLPNCNIKKVYLPCLSLPNMVSLNLDHNKITTLSWVQSFPNLAKLSVKHNRVASFGPTSPHHSATPHFTSLRSLCLDHNRIRNLPPLRLDLFPNLQFLTLNNNEISSITGLKNNCWLEHLMLDKNKLLSITCDQAGRLENLLELYLERNALTRLDFVRNLKKLRKLFIGHNKLVAKSSLEPLADLPNLVELTVHGNPIFRMSVSYRECLPHIPSLQLLEGHPVNK